MDPITGMLIMAGVNAAMGAAKSAQAAKQRQTEANIRAAEIEASPWTNKTASTQISTPSPSLWADMLGGAVSGIGQAQSLQQAGLFKSETDPSSFVAASSPTLMSSSPSPALTRAAMEESSSYLDPSQSKRSMWFNMFNK